MGRLCSVIVFTSGAESIRKYGEMTFEPFHIRERNRERQGQPALYKYDDLPNTLRVQIFRLLQRVIGEPSPRIPARQSLNEPYQDISPSATWDMLWDVTIDELGLSVGRTTGYVGFGDFFFRPPQPYTVSHLFTALEIAFRLVQHLPEDYQQQDSLRLSSQEAIDELNKRFRQHDIGYAFENGTIVRIDSQFLHSQVVDPALQLLSAKGFEGAEHEFLSAHRHFRHGENDDAIVDAARAFESTMKQICDEVGWEYPERANAKDLIRIVSNNGLFPKWHENHMNSLRTLLEGLPTVRNKRGGHGSGSEKREVPDDMAALAIHLAASNIVFLVESFKRLRGS